MNDYGNAEKQRSNANHYSNLDYAENDAEEMSKAVIATAKNIFKDSVLTYTLTQKSNQIPTKENLSRVFEDISKKAKASDVLYIFFAGHGDIPKSIGNGEVRFMLHQASKQNPMMSSFGMKEFKEWLNPQKIKAQKRVFVFDACHSGKFIGDQNNYAYRGDKDESWRQKQLDKLKDKSGLLILAASAEDESSYEDPQLRHGLMSYYLLKNLKEGTKDTTVNVRQWFEQSKTDVESYVSRKYGTRGENGGSPVQSPRIFGDGDFTVGAVNAKVKDQIQLTSVKTILGSVQFTDATGGVNAKIGSIQKQVENELRKRLQSEKMEFIPEKTGNDCDYSVSNGVVMWVNNVSINSYTLKYKNKDVSQIILPQFSTANPQEIAQKLAESILTELEKQMK